MKDWGLEAATCTAEPSQSSTMSLQESDMCLLQFEVLINCLLQFEVLIKTNKHPTHKTNNYYIRLRLQMDAISS